MKVLVVEDNQNEARYMTRTLQDQGFETLSPVDSVSMAIEKIEKEAPEIVIFDYEIRGGFSSDIVYHFIELVKDTKANFPFHFVFLSSHEAKIREVIFDLNHPNLLGIYLKTDFEEAVEQIATKFSHYRSTISRETDLVAFKGLSEMQSQRLILKNDNRCIVVALSQVIYFEADRGYSTAYWVKEGKIKSVLSAKPLSAYEESLKEAYFIKINRGVIINLAFLQEFDNRNTSYVKLEYCPQDFTVTKGFEANLKQAMGLINV